MYGAYIAQSCYHFIETLGSIHSSRQQHHKRQLQGTDFAVLPFPMGSNFMVDLSSFVIVYMRNC